MTDQEDDLIVKLSERSGSLFFDILGQHLKCTIPTTVKKILTFNHYDTIFTLSEFNNDSILEIQDCLRHVFEEGMLEDGEQISEYLGKFVKFQTKFILVSGELRLIEKMAETCKRLYVQQPEQSPSPVTQQDENELEQDSSDIHNIMRTWLLDQENLTQLLLEELELNISFLHKYNGSRSYYMRCPIINCQHKFKIFYKGYRQYYKPKKMKSTVPKIGKGRWHLTSVKSHLLKSHCNEPTEEHEDDHGDLTPGETNLILISVQSTTNLTGQRSLSENRNTPDPPLRRRQVRRRQRNTLDEVDVAPPKRTKRVAATPLTQNPSIRRQPLRGQNRKTRN